MKWHKYVATMAIAVAALAGCSSSNNKKQAQGNETAQTKTTPTATFNADSAYSYVAAQCAFGERVPNTEAHRHCAKYLENELLRHGAKVTLQRADLQAYDGTKLKAVNIIGEYYPEKPNRILLMAHWDCRPWADNDPEESNRRKPVMGANDGASGVGVLLEVARILAKHEPSAGSDILFTDAEDWGDESSDNPDSWALGTQYWAAHPHREGYTRPAFGILLDMVGDRDARFCMEYFSMHSAPDLVARVWSAAHAACYGDYFVKQQGGAITDDHVYLIKAGIPCIDIIDQRTESPTGFCPQWHTTDDTMRHIDRRTLQAVGQTLVNILLGQ